MAMADIIFDAVKNLKNLNLIDLRGDQLDSKVAAIVKKKMLNNDNGPIVELLF